MQHVMLWVWQHINKLYRNVVISAIMRSEASSSIRMPRRYLGHVAGVLPDFQLDFRNFGLLASARNLGKQPRLANAISSQLLHFTEQMMSASWCMRHGGELLSGPHGRKATSPSHQRDSRRGHPCHQEDIEAQHLILMCCDIAHRLSYGFTWGFPKASNLTSVMHCL